jgi:hypothetical protein
MAIVSDSASFVRDLKSKRAADKPFYLAAATNVNAPDDKQQWFVRGPVGRNKLNNLMKSMVKEAGVEIHGKPRVS